MDETTSNSRISDFNRVERHNFEQQKLEYYNHKGRISDIKTFINPGEKNAKKMTLKHSWHENTVESIVACKPMKIDSIGDKNNRETPGQHSTTLWSHAYSI